jgi:hypothetical protein
MVNVKILIGGAAAFAYELFCTGYFLPWLLARGTGAVYTALYLIGFILYIAPVCLVGLLVIVEVQAMNAPRPFQPDAPEGTGNEDDLGDYSPETLGLTEEAGKSYEEEAKKIPNVDARKALARGIKIGMALTAKGGVTFSAAATGRTEIWVDGLKVTVAGNAKVVELPDDVGKESEMVRVVD